MKRANAAAKPADGAIVLSPVDAAQIRLALIMALEGEPSANYKEKVRAAYQLLNPWSATPAASSKEG
jgi:hypothetical protein